jgi:AraC-like DNA-binding protein
MSKGASSLDRRVQPCGGFFVGEMGISGVEEQLELWPDAPKAGERRPVGRPRLVFSEQDQWLAISMERWGYTRDEIASRLGCSRRTVSKRFFGGR